MLGFPGFLRANGFALGGGDVLPLVQVSARVGLLDPQLLRWSFKPLLCGRADEWRRFDGLFDAWFLPPNRWQRPTQREAAEAGVAAPGGQRQAGSSANDDDALTPRDAASRQETLASADFRSLADREHALDIEAAMRRFARRLRWIERRRQVAAKRGRQLDFARTIRASIASGGTPLALAWRRRRVVRPRLVLLIDVSRSMLAYSFFYLRLARALAAEHHDCETFIFHTRCTAVSQALHHPDPWRAQERLHLMAQGWAGGTRIGESLAQFNREHAPRVLHGHTGVIVMSDGYDTGEPRQLAAELAALQRRARRVVWLNPLAARAGYSPTSRGMQAALPHLDLLAPGGSLADIEAVLPRLVQALH